MSLLTRSRKYWSSFTQGSSLLLLLLIPKCSLCLFTVVNTIAVCGLKPVVTPLWENLLVGSFALFQLSITLYEMRRNLRMLPLLISAIGLGAFAGFLFMEQPATYYYAGVLFISLGWVVMRIQKSMACKDECTQSPGNSLLLSQNKTKHQTI